MSTHAPTSPPRAHPGKTSLERKTRRRAPKKSQPGIWRIEYLRNVRLGRMFENTCTVQSRPLRDALRLLESCHTSVLGTALDPIRLRWPNPYEPLRERLQWQHHLSGQQLPSHSLVLEHHPDAFSDLSGEYLLGLPMITPIFSSNGVSGKPGAVQRGDCDRCWGSKRSTMRDASLSASNWPRGLTNASSQFRSHGSRIPEIAVDTSGSGRDRIGRAGLGESTTSAHRRR